MNNYTLAYCYNHTGIDIMNLNGGLLWLYDSIHSIACNAIENTIDTDCTADDNWTPESMTGKDFQDWFHINSIRVEHTELDHNQNPKKQIEFIHDTFKATALFTS